eukprot:UN03473
MSLHSSPVHSRIHRSPHMLSNTLIIIKNRLYLYLRIYFLTKNFVMKEKMVCTPFSIPLLHSLTLETIAVIHITEVQLWCS